MMVAKLRVFNLKMNNALLFIAGVSLVTSMLLVVFNGIIRTFTDPYSGIIEAVSWMAAITTAFSLGSAQISKAHVFIDMVTNKFPLVLQRIVGALITLIGIAFFTMLGIQLIQYGLNLQESGVLSSTLRIPYYPVVMALSLGFLGLITTLVIELLEILSGKERNNES